MSIFGVRTAACAYAPRMLVLALAAKALGLVDKWNAFLKTLIYANRGMARHLQGKEAEARKDFDECIRLNKGERMMLEHHLLDIELRIRILKRIRAERLKGIA